MINSLARTRWMVLLALCCGLNGVVLLSRPVSGELTTDDAVVASSKPVETPVGFRTGLSFPPVLPVEMPFRGDAELFSSATRATGSAVLLASLILLGSFLLKRYWPGRFGALPVERHIAVLETVALGERQSLTLVQVGQSRLLLARTAGSITLLDRAALALETMVESEVEAPAGRHERNKNDMAAALTGAASRFKCVETRLKTGFARVRTALKPLFSEKPRRIPAAPAPSFERVMRAEIRATASSSATTGSAARSRLSEIRNQLQAE